jgi:hypothetical protein
MLPRAPIIIRQLEKYKAAEKNSYRTLTGRTATECLNFALNKKPNDRPMETRQDNS